MKILIANTFYFPNMIGGTENSVKLLAEGLKQQNHDVSVFTIDNLQTKGVVKESIDGVNIYRCDGGYFNTKVRISKKGNVFIKLKNKIIELHNKYIYYQFLKVIDQVKPDIIHTNNLYGLSPLIWKAAKKKNIKLVHTIRDYWILDPSVENKNRKNIFIKLYQSYFRNMSKYVDYVTAPSLFTLNTLIDNKYFSNSNSKVIPNCINIEMDKLKKIIDNRKIKNKNNINFIYVGMLDEKKGIINLLNAFSNIPNKYISLSVCGSGSLEEEVTKFSKQDKRIKYFGQLNKEKLEKVWLDSDVCIVPSIWDEPFGRVVIEANQFGLPVIGSNKGGILEILSNIKTGELFQFDDIDDLKNKIIYFSNKDNVLKYYNSILKNIEYYSLDNQIKMFEKIYKDIN